MDSFELNKVAGAVLGALLFAVGSGFVAELIYNPTPAGEAGYLLEVPPPEAPGGQAAPVVEPIAVRLASANVEKGQGGTKACHACHSFEKGGPNKVGPDLWEIVERPKGGHGGFDYSAALKEKGGTWTYEDLDHFLASPKGFIKGTKMAFAGISSPQERANVIAYLRTLSDNPKPLPAAEKADAKPADAKPADAKPADAKPADAKAADTKPAETKPTASQPAAGKASEGKDSPAKPADTNTAQPVLEKAPGSPKPNTATPNRNEPEPKPDPAAGGPSQSSPVEAAPATPTEPAAKLPPAKADPAAEDKGKTLQEQGSTGGEAGK